MMNEKHVDFSTSIKKGKIGEEIFKQDFLDFLGFDYEDVSGTQSFQIKGTDFVFPLGQVDVKNSYNTNKGTIILEEYTNVAIKKLGWFDTSESVMFIFVDQHTRHMVFIPNTPKLHEWYNANRTVFQHRYNKVSFSASGQWQSSFRVVDLKYIPHSFYNKGRVIRGFQIQAGSGKKSIMQLTLEDSCV